MYIVHRIVPGAPPGVSKTDAHTITAAFNPAWRSYEVRLWTLPPGQLLAEGGEPATPVLLDGGPWKTPAAISTARELRAVLAQRGLDLPRAIERALQEDQQASELILRGRRVPLVRTAAAVTLAQGVWTAGVKSCLYGCVRGGPEGRIGREIAALSNMRRLAAHVCNMPSERLGPLAVDLLGEELRARTRLRESKGPETEKERCQHVIACIQVLIGLLALRTGPEPIRRRDFEERARVGLDNLTWVYGRQHGVLVRWAELEWPPENPGVALGIDAGQIQARVGEASSQPRAPRGPVSDLWLVAAEERARGFAIAGNMGTRCIPCPQY